VAGVVPPLPPRIQNRWRWLIEQLPALGLAVAATLWFAGCGRSEPSGTGLQLATTTSYLEAVARDLLGDEPRVLRLAEPGTCPGHFDLRPSQAQALRRCRVLLRFDFQKSLDARLLAGAHGGPRIAEVSLRGGMGQPDSYLSACRQIAEQFVALGLLDRSAAEASLRAIAARIESLGRDATNRVAQAGLRGAPVLASGHQREFCAWLGLEVVADFRPADTAGLRDIEAALAAGQLARVRLVVANLPEGRRTADALAARVGARVVVFENFPALREGQVSFDEMLRSNVEALRRVAVP